MEMLWICIKLVCVFLFGATATGADRCLSSIGNRMLNFILLVVFLSLKYDQI